MEKLVLPHFADLWYDTVSIRKVKDAIMERWHRAFTQDDKHFKELFGVKKKVFLEMYEILSTAYQSRHRRGGRPPKLSVGDQLLLAVQYWREYRTMKHLAYDFGIAKSTVSETVTLVENILIQDGRFHLLGKKALVSRENAGRTFVVDVTESPIQRPQKK